MSLEKILQTCKISVQMSSRWYLDVRLILRSKWVLIYNGQNTSPTYRLIPMQYPILGEVFRFAGYTDSKPKQGFSGLSGINTAY